jgi:cell division protein FtsB
VKKKTTRSGSDSSSTAPPRRRRRAVQWVIVFAALVIAVDALVGDNGLMAMMKARQEYRALEQSLTAARAENARLREEARRLREDPSAVEEIARRELGLVRPGEKLFIIKDVNPADQRSRGGAPRP